MANSLEISQFLLIKSIRRFVRILNFYYNFILLLEFKAKANDAIVTIVESSYVIIKRALGLSHVRRSGSVGIVIYYYAKRVAFRASMDSKKTIKWVEFDVFL